MKSAARRKVALVALALVALAVRESEAHGWMQIPAARNVLLMQKGTNAEKDSVGWCPHCGQGRGGGAPGGILTGVCGDPYQGVSNPAITPMSNGADPPTGRYYGVGATLTEGQTLDVQVWLDTNHGGRQELSVCPMSKDTPPASLQACFDNPANKLTRVSPGNANQDGKRYWYIPNGTTSGMFITATFKLPAAVSCAGGCMMQWNWIATQTCSPPCEDPSIDVPDECGKNPIVGHSNVCTDYTTQPEWFRNCADIIIQPAGSGGGGGGGGGGGATSSPPPPVVVSSPPPPAAVASPPPPPVAVASPPPPASGGGGGSGGTLGTCAPSDWQCQACLTASQASPTAAGFFARCNQCASGQSYADACASCLKGAPNNPDIIGGCLDCIAQRPSLIWACRDICSTWRCSPN